MRRRADRRPSACRTRGSCACPAGSAATRARTPMQWDDGPNAGFCATGASRGCRSPTTPARVNVAAQRDDPDSMLSLYRDLLALRRAEPALRPAPTARSRPTATCSPTSAATSSVALNLSGEPVETAARGVVLLGTNPAREGETLRRALRLAGGEAVIVRTSRGA